MVIENGTRGAHSSNNNNAILFIRIYNVQQYSYTRLYEKKKKKLHC